MADTPETLTRFAALDRRLVAAVKGIKLLAAVSWPASVQSLFLQNWHSGRALCLSANDGSGGLFSPRYSQSRSWWSDEFRNGPTAISPAR